MTASKERPRQTKVTDELKGLLRNMLDCLESSHENPPSEEEQRKLLGALQEYRAFNPDNRRKHARKSCALPITVGVLRIYSEIVKDISNGGLFIDTTSSFSLGESLTLIFSPSDDSETVRITGRVVRKTEEGIGVEFTTPISDELKEMIESL